jgi:hypothetical protein
MSDKKCRMDIKSHPIKGIEIISIGEKAACDAKRKEAIKDAGPYLKKFVTRRWVHKET